MSGYVYDEIAPETGPEPPQRSSAGGGRGYDPDEPFDYAQDIPEELKEIGEVAGSSIERTDPRESLIQYEDDQRDQGQTSARLAAEDAMLNPLDPYIDPAGQEEGELPPGLDLPEPEEPDPQPLPVEEEGLPEGEEGLPEA